MRVSLCCKCMCVSYNHIWDTVSTTQLFAIKTMNASDINNSCNLLSAYQVLSAITNISIFPQSYRKYITVSSREREMEAQEGKQPSHQ